MGNLIKEIKKQIFEILQDLNVQNINCIQETYIKKKFETIRDIEDWKDETLQFITKNFNLKYAEIMKYLNIIETNIVGRTEKDT